ncbi:hypothetical protein FOXB_01610 [Fusarium oxysporum f. sp. conglutinans Fo5176]|uniref:Uncharacterized protein n=1 Tax=Fusarium oxysporum (strain Fo5176) TaxID=660025 RepID=F9F5D5_FUSOF|nr:hypothetical protein FOXB_01610 [Fusarium oxysporum f. sp. conglutinans Fo5176]KAI8416127.1 hypothetical protein FOFC_02436 [Fusarium oxysporum]
MKEDSFVSRDKGTGERSDDEYSLDGSVEYSVNTVEESEGSGDSEREEDEGSEESGSEESGSEESEESEESGSEESGSEESEESEESGSEESGSEESEESEEEDEEKKGNLLSDNHVLDMLDKPYKGSKATIGAGKNEKPKRHPGERYPGTRGSRGDSTTLISSGAFQYPDSYHSPDPASVSNNRSLEKSTKQPNGMPKSPSKLHFDGWMPHRYARISTIQGDNTSRPRAYLITRDKFSKIEKELTGDKGRKLTRRDGDCLRGIEQRKFQVQNIAVGRDGSNGLNRGMGQGESRSVFEFIFDRCWITWIAEQQAEEDPTSRQ